MENEDNIKLDVSLKTENNLSEDFYCKKIAAEAAAKMMAARARSNKQLSLDDIETRFGKLYDVVYKKIKGQS